MTSRGEYEAAGAGIGTVWRETGGRIFPPATLLKSTAASMPAAEIEVTAFVPTAWKIIRSEDWRGATGPDHAEGRLRSDAG